MAERDWVKQSYSKELEIGRESIRESDRDLHDYILRGLSELDPADLDYIFGVRDPSRLISEGEQIIGNVTVEDFAVTGSYNGGEMAIGQVASCNGKNLVGSLPRDYRQVNRFGEAIQDNPEIDPEITGYYLVRSRFPPEEVKSRSSYFDRDLNFFGKSTVEVEILRIEPEERDIEKAMTEFYSSLTQP